MDDDRHVLLLLPRDSASVAKARSWLGEFLAQITTSDRVCSDAMVVISELVSNGLRHGLGDIVVRASCEQDGALRVAVTDAGDGKPTVLPPDPSRIGGVGLRLVAEMSRSWGIASFPGGTTVSSVLADDR